MNFIARGTPHSTIAIHPVITIDGPAGSGKSAVADLLARRLGFARLDTGALYRALALAMIEAGVTLDNADGTARVLARAALDCRAAPGVFEVRLGGRLLDAELRTPAVTALVSPLSARPAVRALLLPRQRALADRCPLVAEGRDMGTVVFPRAPYKFFLTASLAERARRRARDFAAAGRPADLETVAAELAARDERDRSRAVAPLRAAADAIVIDTEARDLAGVVDALLARLPADLREPRAPRDPHETSSTDGVP